MTYATPKPADVEKQAAVETVVKQTGYAKRFYKFEIRIVSSFTSNEA